MVIDQRCMGQPIAAVMRVMGVCCNVLAHAQSDQAGTSCELVCYMFAFASR
jgi:hypothetical protein